MQPKPRSPSGPRARVLALAAVLALLAAAAPGAQPASEARALAAAAEAKLFAEDVYGAVEDYLAAVARNPSYAEALLGLAECYYEL